MNTLWFAFAAFMLAMYVVLDGFDFGAGTVHRWAAKTDRERRQILAAIGPFWDGNEVWLLAAGGVLFLAFPKVLASALSGFYLAIFLLLWVLLLRGIAIEFRSHLGDRMWRSFWDTVFAGASTLAPVLLGAALGNLLRGVPLGPDGWFALPLFDSFSPRGALGVLDWYTVLAGGLAWAAVAHHGALFLAWKTGGEVQARSVRIAARLFPAVVGLWIAATAATAALAPEVFDALRQRPPAWIATAVFVAGLGASAVARRRGADRTAFLGSAAFLFGILSATVVCLYPTLVKSSVDTTASLTVWNAASTPHALSRGLLWWPAGLVLAGLYTAFLFRMHRGKAGAAAEGDGY